MLTDTDISQIAMNFASDAHDCESIDYVVHCASNDRLRQHSGLDLTPAECQETRDMVRSLLERGLVVVEAWRGGCEY